MACVAATVTVIVTMSLTVPFLGIWLDNLGGPVRLNDLNATAHMLAILFLAPAAPGIIGPHGLLRVIAIGGSSPSPCLRSFPRSGPDFPLRFLSGILVTVGDIRVNQLVAPGHSHQRPSSSAAALLPDLSRSALPIRRVGLRSASASPLIAAGLVFLMVYCIGKGP